MYCNKTVEWQHCQVAKLEPNHKDFVSQGSLWVWHLWLAEIMMCRDFHFDWLIYLLPVYCAATGYIALYVRIIVNDELERIWKEMFTFFVTVLCDISSRSTPPTQKSKFRNNLPRNCFKTALFQLFPFLRSQYKLQNPTLFGPVIWKISNYKWFD